MFLVTPHRIITDKGAAFTSDAFKNYCEAENIMHSMITTGVPRGNGQVERMNAVVINSLARLSCDDPLMWYKHTAK